MPFYFVAWKSNTLRSKELLVAPNATVIAVAVTTRGSFLFMFGFLSLFNISAQCFFCALPCERLNAFSQSEARCAAVCSSAIPHFGHLLGLSLTASPCIGPMYFGIAQADATKPLRPCIASE